VKCGGKVIDWFAVIDRTTARVFERHSLIEPFELACRIEDPLGRERNRALQYDRPGRDHHRAGNSFVSEIMSGGKDPHRDAAEQFVRKVARFLIKERAKNNFERLHIVADSFISGALRNDLDELTLKRVSGWTLKNFSKKSDHEVAQTLGSKLKFSGADVSVEIDNEIVPGDIPMTITFRDFSPTDSVQLAVQKQIEKLKRFRKRFVHCEVILSAPHRRHHKGLIYHVEIRLSRPGEDIYVSRERERNKDHSNIYIAIRDEFLALRKKLLSMTQIERGDVKNHKIPPARLNSATE
jgi:hypothetical protein